MINETKNTESSKKFVQCKDLVKIFFDGSNSVTALRGITHRFENGNIYVVFGPSGAGKTTFLSVLGGLELPTSGIINFNDKFTIDNQSQDLFYYRINNVSFIFQEPIFIPFLTVEENLKFFKNIRKENYSERIEWILKKTNLIDRRKHYPY
ncbi:MAG: ATP-binding cassette domain-containing protein, partial [Promethearchaeota archaeon]